MADEKKRTDFAEWDPTARIELPPLFLPRENRPTEQDRRSKMRQAAFVVIIGFTPLIVYLIIYAIRSR